MLSEQETFWTGDFGDAYVDRNNNHSKLYYFSKILLANRIDLNSVIELGANIGINLDALITLYPKIITFGVEINAKAYAFLSTKHKAYLGSVFHFENDKTYDLAFALVFSSIKHLIFCQLFMINYLIYRTDIF